MRKVFSKPPLLLCSITASFFLILAFPNFEYSLFVWVALSFLIYPLIYCSSLKSLLYGFLTGFFFFAFTMYWTAGVMTVYGGVNSWVSHIIALLLWSYLALYFSLFAFLFCWFRRHLSVNSALFMAPFLWVLLEYIRSYFLTGLPWLLLAHSQYRNVMIIQICSITGVYGLSFLILSFNSLLVYLTVEKKRKYKLYAVLSALSVFLLLLVWGNDRLTGKAVSEKDITVAVIQGNVPQDLVLSGLNARDILRNHLQLTFKAVKDGAELVVWSESSVPLDLGERGIFRKSVSMTADKYNIHMVVGSVTSGDDCLWNSAFTVDEEGNFQERYDKRHLVPFGEYVPFNDFLTFLGPLVNEVGTFRRGEKAVINDVNGVTFGVPICYEISFPDNIRDFVKNGVDFIVNITNDGWYGQTPACRQHLANLPFRAVENSRNIVRAANTGISCFVNSRGKILTETPLEVETYLLSSLSLCKEKTIYTCYGDVLVWFSLLVVLSGLVLGKFCTVKNLQD